MRETGLEPARYYYHQALNLARLPIPPFPRERMRPSRRRPTSEARGILDRFSGQSSGLDETACGRSRRVAAASAAILAAAMRPKVASVQAASPSGIQR